MSLTKTGSAHIDQSIFLFENLKWDDSSTEKYTPPLLL